MGYGSTGCFMEHMYIFDNNGIRPGATICELGDQTVRIPEKDGLKYIIKFIEHYGEEFDSGKYEPFIGNKLHVRMVYEDAGFSYISVDLNETDDSWPIDLNEWPNSALPDCQFDVVTNFGTTEHVGNQLNAFAIIHYLTKPAGLMMHQIPTIHYSAHAMNVVTPYFLKKLIDSNRYEILEAKMQSHDIDSALVFHHSPDLEFIDGFTADIQRSTVAAMSCLLLRKIDDASFVPPLDVGADDANVLSIVERYIERFGAASTVQQRKQAFEHYVSNGPTPTEEIVRGVSDKRKRVDRTKLIKVIESSNLGNHAEKQRETRDYRQQHPRPEIYTQEPQTIVFQFPKPTRREIMMIGAICAAFAIVSLVTLIAFAFILSVIIR